MNASPNCPCIPYCLPCRLAAEYSDSLMNVFLVPAADLGRGLQVPSHMSTVFGGEQRERGCKESNILH